MNEGQKLKGRFTQRWLANSDEYYYSIFVRLFYAQYSYLEKKGYAITLELNTPEQIEVGDVIITRVVTWGFPPTARRSLWGAWGCMSTRMPHARRNRWGGLSQIWHP